jgi:hypothetical protein
MPAGATQCRPVTSLAQFKPGVGQSGDYLRYPAALQGDPTNQFQAFESGQGIHPGSATQWLDDPGRLDPWSTAQVYFYYAGVLGVRQWQDAHLPAGAPAGLIGLEYWFFYPFNYYPTVVGSQVMNDAPLAADKLNTDLHQGDWEHVTVLLSPGSLTPRWIYMARHDGEGQFYRWDSQALQFDHGHPIVQAAFGGHPTYDNNCGGRPRPKIGDALDDWVVCGSSRFAFSAGRGISARPSRGSRSRPRRRIRLSPRAALSSTSRAPRRRFVRARTPARAPSSRRPLRSHEQSWTECASQGLLITGSTAVAANPAA